MKTPDDNAEDPTQFFIHLFTHVFIPHKLTIYLEYARQCPRYYNIEMNKTMFYALNGLNPLEVHK